MNVVMTRKTAKEDYIQLRIDSDFKKEVELTAAARRLSVSALILNLLSQTVRQEKEAYPSVFETTGVKATEIRLKPVAKISSPKAEALAATRQTPSKADVQRMVSDEQIEEMERRLKPRRKKTG